MGKQILKNDPYDSRLQGNWYYWTDKYGNTYTHYTERQQDGKFYGEFTNKRTNKTNRFWFAKKKLVYAKLATIYNSYNAKWDKKEANLAKKRAERKALEPVLTAKELKAKKIQAKMNR